MTERPSGLVTILFTDLVGSTELLSRAGDDEAQRIFRAHHDLLAKAAAVHGGQEVKWLGDGLMVAFPSAVDALRCAVAMQEESRRPIQGERLAIRVGLNAGEAIRDESDYFGLPVVIARRLCDRADAGQILCTEVVAGLLVGRAGFAFSELGKLELKGVADPVGACEVRYEVEPGAALPSRTHFVGRQTELRRLMARLGEAAAGAGGLVVVAGEPGIGKTRLAEEVAERARGDGTLVLWGHCLEGEWSPPYAPFVEALDAQVGASEPDQLRADLGAGAATLAQLVPRIRQVLPDVADPVSVQPDEERFRLLEAVAQALVARGRRAPVLLCLEDLHWADRGTVAMLRHVARFAPRSRVLVLGTFRGAEVGPDHPLSDALAALRREVEYERIDLSGLGVDDVEELIASFAEHEVSRGFVTAVTEETEGNPFFIRELISYFIEVGTVYRGPDGRWTSGRPIRELGIPEGVREVIGRRLARLSEGTRRLLAVGAAFEGPFRFDVVRTVADLGEDDALDSIDQALAAQVLQPSGVPDAYTFAHALIRTTLYGSLSTSRQVRLHRRMAEALEAASGPGTSPAQAGEIAAQYHRSAGLPGAEKGVEPALMVADHAEATGAHDEAATFLRMALELLPEASSQRPRLLGRLGLALIWARVFDDAVPVAAEAGNAFAEAEGTDAAVEYLSEAAYAANMAGSPAHAWGLARQGLACAGTRHDVAWARLVSFDHMRREAEDAQHPGIPLDTPERRESARILRAARLDPLGPGPIEAVFDSRDEALTSTNLTVIHYWCGEFARALPLLQTEVEASLSRGQLNRAARGCAVMALCQSALGRLGDAQVSFEKAAALAARVGQPVWAVLLAREALAVAVDEGLEELDGVLAPLTGSVIPGLAWAEGSLYAWAARTAARLGRADEALRYLERLVPWLARAPAWTVAFPLMASHAAETLWVLETVRHVSVVERSLREKVIGPDFRSPMVDGRLALARVCALQSRWEEATQWFAESRGVLNEQGALPLLAIADHDEALMYIRRGEPGDLERARPLLDAARRQFEAIGMTGWIRRADELSERLD